MTPILDPDNATPEELMNWANKSIQAEEYTSSDGMKYASSSGKSANHDRRCTTMHRELLLSIKENRDLYGPLADFEKDKDGMLVPKMFNALGREINPGKAKLASNVLWRFALRTGGKKMF